MRKNNRQTGSSDQVEPVFLAVGRLRKPHGIGGEIVLEVLTEFPERFQIGEILYVGDSHQEVLLTDMRPFGNQLLVRIDGVNDRDAAGRFRNQYIFINAEDSPDLPDGEYYHHELIGLDVVDDAGNALGVLEEILETGANDVYVIINTEKKETLIPALESVLISVDLEEGILHVRPPEWD